MLQALIRTITEILDSKKAAYSFIAAIGASVLHLYFKVSVQDSILLVSPLGLATISQAHVDAAAAKQPKAPAPAPKALPAVPPVPAIVAATAAATNDGSAAKTDG